MYLPVLLALPPPAARVKSPPPKRFRINIERQPTVHINGWFVTAARMFQRAEGCAVLMHCSTIALHYFALTSTSDAVSSSFVPRFQRSGYSSLLFASVRVPVCSDLILSDSLCTRLIGFCLVIGVMMGVGCEAPNLRSIL